MDVIAIRLVSKVLAALTAELVTAPFRRRRVVADDPPRSRASLVRQYQNDTPPQASRLPQTKIELIMLGFSIDHSTLRAAPGAPALTKGLLLSLCLPFCKRNGFAVSMYGLQPFMVWEHQEKYRLFTSIYLHSDVMHLLNNLNGLANFSSFLETTVTKSISLHYTISDDFLQRNRR